MIEIVKEVKLIDVVPEGNVSMAYFFTEKGMNGDVDALSCSSSSQCDCARWL